MKTTSLILTAVITLTLSSFGAHAQMQRPPLPKGDGPQREHLKLTPKERATQRTEEMHKTVRLDEKQYKKIYKIFLSEENAKQAAMENGPMGPPPGGFPGGFPGGQDITTMIAFRRSYQGYLWNHISGQQTVSSNQTAVERPEFGKMKKGPAYFYDLNAKITYTPTNRDIISVSFFNGADYNDNTPQFGFDGGGPPGMPGGGSFNGMKISMDNADYQRYGNLGTSLRWARKVNDRWSMNLLGSFSYFYATRDQSRTMSVTKNGTTEENTSGTYETNDLYDISLKNDWKYQINDNNALEFGAFGTRYDIEYSYTQNGDEELLRKRNNAIMLGVYVQDKMKFAGNRFILTPGVRANFYTADKKAYFEPRLSASYSLTSSLTVNATTGIFCQRSH